MRNEWKKTNLITCKGKNIFYTWKQAQTATNYPFKKRARLRSIGKKIERLHPYKCEACGNFHVGHPSRRGDRQPPPL